MESSETVEDSFKTRVDKVFGSLQHRSPSDSAGSSPWSVTDFPVTRRDWKKGRDVEDSCTPDSEELLSSSSFDETGRPPKRRCSMASEFDDEEGDDGEDEDGGDDDQDMPNRRGMIAEEDWEISASIGMDRTLDEEEEEDEFDRVAEGKENAGGSLHMKDVIDKDLSRFRVASIPLGIKDPRANHLAANIRLQEDNDEGQKLNAEVEEQSELTELSCKTSEEEASGHGNLRPILKRNEDSCRPKSKKKVKFDPNCQISCIEETAMDTSDAMFSVNGLPDYLCNPSRYTRYSFDTSDIDDKSNCDAYLDFMELIKGSNSRGLPTDNKMQDPGGCSKSVTFIPRKKHERKEEIPITKIETDSRDSNHLHQTALAAGIAAEESVESEHTAMDEDEQEASLTDPSVRNRSRKYRAKSSFADSD